MLYSASSFSGITRAKRDHESRSFLGLDQRGKLHFATIPTELVPGHPFLVRVGVIHTVGSSCQCAQAVAKGLKALGHELLLVNSEEIELRALELAQGCDLVIDHTDTFRGRGILRPLVRLLLEVQGARVVGSDARACFLADDKIAAKAKLAEAGIPTPPGIVVTAERWQIPPWLHPPLVIKPAFEHMSRGLGLAQTEGEAYGTVTDLREQWQQPVLVEQFIPGRELAVSLLAGAKGMEVLPALEWRFADEGPQVLTEASKLADVSGERKDALRADLSPCLREEVEGLAGLAFQARGLRYGGPDGMKHLCRSWKASRGFWNPPGGVFGF